MPTVDIGQKVFWPQRAIAQQSTTPDHVSISMGGGSVGTPTYTNVRCHGRIKWADDAAHTPSKVYWVCGTVTENLTVNGGVVVVSVRAQQTDMWTDTGTLYGTGTRSTDLTANAINSVTLGSTASLPHLTRIVVKFAPGTAYQVWQLRNVETDETNHYPGVYTNDVVNSGAQSQVPCLLFEAVDGTFGIIEDSTFFESTTTLDGFKNDGVSSDLVNEHGVRFTVPNDSRAIGFFAVGSANTGVTGFNVALAAINGSNVPSAPLSEVSLTRLDWGMGGSTQGRPGFYYYASPVSLTAGQSYVLTMRNLSSSTGATHTMTLQKVVIGSASYAPALQLGTTYSHVSRAGGTGAFNTVTAYTVTTTEWLNMGVILDQYTVASGGGGNGSSASLGGGFAG